MSENSHTPQSTVFAFEETSPEPEIKWRETLRLFCANRAALLGLVVVLRQRGGP